MKENAIDYYDLGLNPTCISYIKTKYNINENNPEKAPCHAWRRWQVRRPTLKEISDLNWDFSNGIGAVLGHTTRCIDIDNCNDYDFIKEFLKSLGLPVNYEWTVKTPNGFHIHLICNSLTFATQDELIEGVLTVLPNQKYTTIFSRIELRWASHIVLPPTIINGQSYKFLNNTFPNKKPSNIKMSSVFKTIAQFCGSFNGRVGNFETNNVIFQIGIASTYDCPDNDLRVARGSYIKDAVMQATNSDGIIALDNLSKLMKIDTTVLDSIDSQIKKWQRELFFLDLETTGLIENQLDYENYPRITQIAYKKSSEKEINSIFIKPNGFTISKEIEKLTGISTELLNAKGINIRDAFSLLDITSSSQIVAHNIDFDLSILDSEYLRILKTNPNTDFKNTHRNSSRLFCTMKKFASVFNVKYPTLTEMYNHFFDDIPQYIMHNAENDVEVLIDCFHIMELYGYIKTDYDKQIIT